MMKKFFILFILTLSFLFLSDTNALAVNYINLIPSTYNVTQGGTFVVNVELHTPDTASSGTDVVLTYNPQVLTVQDVVFQSPLLYAGENKKTIDNTNGKLILNSSVISAAYAYKGNGILAVITFKVEGTGTATVSIVCTASTTNGDSNIWSTQAQDIINCSSNIGGTYTITSGSSSSPTATPGVTNPTSTPVPPVAGNASLTIFPVILGGLFLMIGLFSRLLFLKT